tara:strand:- start:467 stop:661 length:195 start_codon:yes stop_codon:yes gene_type:complete
VVVPATRQESSLDQLNAVTGAEHTIEDGALGDIESTIAIFLSSPHVANTVDLLKQKEIAVAGAR